MNIVGVMMDLEEISFCAFSVHKELYQFYYNGECAYIDRMEDHFTIKLDKEKAKGVYQYLKRQQ